MPLCQICRNDARFDGLTKEQPALGENERCRKCNRTPDMEKEDLGVDTEP